MKSPTYRLPDDLGGWPVRIIDDGERAMGQGYRVVITEGPYQGSLIILDHKVKLVAVAPPLPDEPPVGSVMRALLPDEDDEDEDEPAAVERTKRGWFATGSASSLEWAELCQRGAPVLLVPDPFRDAPELPYEHTDDDGDWARIELTASGARLTCQGTDGQVVEVFVARAFALAALRATTKEG